jgi:hypothetical protein
MIKREASISESFEVLDLVTDGDWINGERAPKIVIRIGGAGDLHFIGSKDGDTETTYPVVPGVYLWNVKKIFADSTATDILIER